ncbi:unnamed protein product [Acanthoscelides obtectus]|uniref:Ig-like domain-containing protein n=1 Tax=Acanthoscelides obtectus TaxID=200917 RepID=A0A9P0PK83_ACAOB|nr:unnamed protein product [Acanthoscelides obtectus]CAK1646296.1 Netrin receptor UNC5B-b [Acanthoscelides obtectus]
MVEIGHQVDLKCVAPSGMPPPRVYWLRGNQLLQSDTDVLVTSEGHLLIGQARPQDTGNYTCVAENIAAKRMAPVSQIIVYAHELIADEKSSDEEEEIETGLQEGFTVGQKASADVNTPHEVAEDQAKGKEEQDIFITEIVKSTSKRKITQSAEPVAKQLRPRINSNPTSSKNKDSKQN